MQVREGREGGREGERGQQTSQGRAGAGNYGANPATLRRHEPLLVL